MLARLVTIPFSHYCEKARWGLDRARVAYVEDPHVPMFAWLPAFRAGRTRTVPVLVTDEAVFADSHAIVAYAHRVAPTGGLYPHDIAEEVEALEKLFDEKVGPAARRLAYHALMKEPRAIGALFRHHAARGEAVATRALLPAMLAMMKRGLKLDDAGAARSRDQLAPVTRDVEARLAKSGGPWLFGARFTAADLTFAALMAPLVLPRAYTDAHFPPGFEDIEAPRALVEGFRATDAGRFALRAYDEERATRAVR